MAAGTLAVGAPNFVVIQADDLGWDDLGIHGNPLVHTPHLDALARESARFAQFTVNPVCAPSRATFLTGRHFLRTGVSHVHGGKDFLHREERTLADHLGAAGYATGMWGKWHLGDADGYFPWQRGFGEAYMADLYRHRESRGRFNGEPLATERWADALIVDQAIDFIGRHREQPFLAYLATLTPHGPHDAPAHWVAFYEKRGVSPALAKLWGMVSFLDEQVGRLLAALDDAGLADRTVVVFMSDNGPAFEGGALSDEDRAMRKVSGLRGWKGDLYENAVRSPLFIRWPGRIRPRTIDRPVDLADLTPTILAWAGVRAIEGSPPLDGISLAPLLAGEDEKVDERPVFNYAHRGWLSSGPPYSLDGIPGEYAPVSAAKGLSFEDQVVSVRVGRHKLMVNPEFSGEPHVMLVDLGKDPGEATDAGDPETRGRLLDLARKWWEQLGREPHAFRPPLFSLKPGENIVPAKAPCAVRGAAFNTVTELKGWARPGDGAEYSLHAEQAGQAEVTLRWKPAPPAGTRWRLAVPENGSEATTDGTSAVGLALPAGDFRLVIELESVQSAERLPGLRAVEVRL